MKFLGMGMQGWAYVLGWWAERGLPRPETISDALVVRREWELRFGALPDEVSPLIGAKRPQDWDGVHVLLQCRGWGAL